MHLSNMQDEISKLSNQLLQSSEKEKEPFQGQQYQTMVNEIGLTGDTTTRTDEIKAVVTLRSGRELKTAVPELVKSAPVVTEPLQKEQSVAKEENPEDECTETILGEQVQLQPQEELKKESVEAPDEMQDTLESGDTFWPWKKENQTSALTSEEESQEEECPNGTMVEEPCLQQPQQGLVENSESLENGVVVCLWEKEDVIPLLLTEEAVEENKENIFPLPPTDSVYILPLPAPQSQPKTPLPVAPSDDQVYILSTPAQKSKPSAPAPKGKSNPLQAMQKFKDLVAIAQIFATTSNKMANAYIAWHSGWFGCGFGFGTPGPRHF